MQWRVAWIGAGWRGAVWRGMAWRAGDVLWLSFAVAWLQRGKYNLPESREAWRPWPGTWRRRFRRRKTWWARPRSGTPSRTQRAARAGPWRPSRCCVAYLRFSSRGCMHRLGGATGHGFEGFSRGSIDMDGAVGSWAHV